MTADEVTDIMGPYDDSLRSDDGIEEFVGRFVELMRVLSPTG